MVKLNLRVSHFDNIGPGTLPVSGNQKDVDSAINKAVVNVQASPSGISTCFFLFLLNNTKKKERKFGLVLII